MDNGKGLAGRAYVVTGGGSGMGLAAAMRLARRGASVTVAGRRAEPLERAAEAIRKEGGQALAIVADVADEAQVVELVARTVAAFGRLDGAFNNAGVEGVFAPVHTLAADDFDAVVAVNLRGVFLCVKHEVAAMLDGGFAGSIVNNSSWTAHGGMPWTSAYAATKAGIDALARAVALEVGGSGIRVNNVAPGVIDTPMSRRALGETDRMPFAQHAAMRRLGLPEDVADAVAWLLSDDARFVTGQSILVDGGYTIGGRRP